MNRVTSGVFACLPFRRAGNGIPLQKPVRRYCQFRISFSKRLTDRVRLNCQRFGRDLQRTFRLRVKIRIVLGADFYLCCSRILAGRRVFAPAAPVFAIIRAGLIGNCRAFRDVGRGADRVFRAVINAAVTRRVDSEAVLFQIHFQIAFRNSRGRVIC